MCRCGLCVSLGLGGGAGTFAIGAFVGASEWTLGCGAFLWDTCCCKLPKNMNKNAHVAVIQ